MNRHATALALAVALTVMASALAGCSSTHAPAPAGDGAHAMATPTSPSTSPSTSSEGSATPTSEAGAPMDADPTLDALPMWAAPAEASALSRAEGFVRAWARPDLDATTWLTGVNGYLSASAAEKFRWTDPSLIPATTVTAAPSRNAGGGTSSSRPRAAACSSSPSGDSSTASTGWMSGSPNRTLNSMTRGPAAVSASPT